MKKLISISLLAALAFGFEFNLDSKGGAIENLTDLGAPSASMSVNLNNDAALTGADYDAGKKQFALVSRDNEFYIADENLKPLRYGKHDRHFIMEMEATVGAAWHKNEVGMISFNKTFISYEPADGLDKAEQDSQWRHLEEGWDKWKLNDFGNKNRFFTIRAKQQYILGYDYDAAANKFIIASVPSDVRDSWSVGVFDGDDKMVLEEYVPALSSNLKLKNDRKPGEYYVTGIDVQGDVAYLLSKNFSTILKLNLKSKEIEEAYGFSGASNPHALAVKDGKFYVFSREGKENKVFIFDMK